MTSGDGSLSLVDKAAMGGIAGGRGYSDQARYIAGHAASWATESTFEFFQDENVEDCRVVYRDFSDYHQAKTKHLGLTEIGRLISEFRGRNVGAITEKTVRHFVIAHRDLSKEARNAVEALGAARRAAYGARDRKLRDRTEQDLRKKFAPIDKHYDFLMKHVRFVDLPVLGENEDAANSVAIALMKARFVSTVFEEAQAAARAFLLSLSTKQRKKWTRADLDDFLANEVATFRAGPPRDAGDYTFFRHEGVRHVSMEPDQDEYKHRIGERRIRRVQLSHAIGDGGKWDPPDVLEAEAKRLVEHVADLRRDDNQVLYYGFPHVPFAVLAGYLFGSSDTTDLVEHDRTTGAFAWPHSEETLTVVTSDSHRPSGSEAVLLASVSVPVDDALCHQLSGARSVLRIGAKKPGLGVVRSAADLNSLYRAFNEKLPAELGGRKDLTALHVYAAVPVTVAFRLGQTLSAKMLPNAFVYNYSPKDSPPYKWRLSLHAAATEQPCIEVMK